MSKHSFYFGPFVVWSIICPSYSLSIRPRKCVILCWHSVILCVVLKNSRKLTFHRLYSNTLHFHCPKNMTRTRWFPAAQRLRPQTTSARSPAPSTLGEQGRKYTALERLCVECGISQLVCSPVIVSWSVLWWTLGAAPCVAAGTTVCASSYLPGPAQHPPASPAVWWSLRSWPAPHRWWRGKGWPAESFLWAQPGCSFWGEETAQTSGKCL